MRAGSLAAVPTVVPQRYEPAVPLERLQSHPLNPRIHDDEAIAESLDAHGFYGAVLAQESSGRIIAGHGRLENAQAKGYASLPVLWLDVDDAEAERMLLHDNRTSDAGRYDTDRLADALASLVGQPLGLFGTGWSQADFDALVPSGLTGALDDLRLPPHGDAPPTDEQPAGEPPPVPPLVPGDTLLSVVL
jgi:hypothetical protein